MRSLALAFGSMAAGTRVLGQTPPANANAALTNLHQEGAFNVEPARLYDTLLSSKEFSAFTKTSAKIDAVEGGAFSLFGGLIVGRNVELTPKTRIVQAWRAGHWDAGLYSIVKFELRPQGAETLLVLDHCGFPAGEYDHLLSGWKAHYYDPLKKHFA